MRSEWWIFTGALIVLCCGCTLTMHTGGRDANTRPAKIIEENEGQTAQIDTTTEAPNTALIEELKRQEAAIGQKAGEEETAVVPGGESAEAGQSGQAQAAAELSVGYLIAQLEQRSPRTAEEEEAYGRLLGIAKTQKPLPGLGESYDLLGEARDAVIKGNLESARDSAAKALVSLRARTDPSIERLCFATAVRSYGSADVVKGEFAAGQQVLLVTDLSSFTCEPLAGDPPAGFHTKMTQRVAVYGSEGRLVWQKSYAALECQSAHYIGTMFIPCIFTLPNNLKPGQYNAKVEIIDHLSNRQTEAGIQFEVR